MISPVKLTVNGERREALVSSRTQLAELLRDKLNLTATHLGCEQGVCGACTVLVDGKPVRSCITYAQACEGAVVETLEGFRDDPVMDDLRRAFTKHHALQCGFCTPGMIITARDIVKRLEAPDEERIRHELSGNLCRCTGYMGIVAAIRDVIENHNPEQDTAEKDNKAQSKSCQERPDDYDFIPFEIAPEFLIAPHRIGESDLNRYEEQDGWTVITRSFTLPHGVDEVWSLFDDIGAVAKCIPGVAIDSLEDDAFTGKIEIRFGPINARFAGEGTRTSDHANRTGTISGVGKDANGQSNVQGKLSFALSQEPGGPGCRVQLELRFQIQGFLAQFNRRDLVESFVDIVMKQFISNCDTVLRGDELDGNTGLSAFSLVLQFLKLKIKSWFQKPKKN